MKERSAQLAGFCLNDLRQTIYCSVERESIDSFISSPGLSSSGMYEIRRDKDNLLLLKPFFAFWKRMHNFHLATIHVPYMSGAWEVR